MTAALVLALPVLATADLASPDGPPADSWEKAYAGKSLADALRHLQSLGLKIVFTSNVVTPEMSIESEPTASDPRQILEELLAPHALAIRAGPEGTIVVVTVPTARREELTIGGVVRSRTTSSPVAAASVRIVETGLEVSSAADGTFRFVDPGEGSFTLEASKAGYLAQRVEGIAASSGHTTQVEIDLEPLPILQEELVVTPSRVMLLRHETVAPFALGREEILALPHLGNDFFRALSLLPGISSNDVTAQFHVRGGRRDETQILLDGQELYESYHLKDFDNALSIIEPQSIDSVNLTTGGFSVEFGDRMSGVLDMTTSTPSGPTRVRLGASILSAHAGGSGAFHDRRGSWIAGIRRGSTDFAGRIFGAEEPKYWSAFGKLDYGLTPSHGLRLNLLHTDDEFELDEIVDEESKRIETEYDNSYTWLTHQGLLQPELLVETAVSHSRINRDRRAVESEEDAQFRLRDERQLEVVGLRQRWSHQLAPRHFLEWGFELREFETHYDYLNVRSFDNPLSEIRDRPDVDSTVFRNRFDEHHHGFYASDRLRIREPLTLQLGLRYDRYSQTDESHLSPRINLAYALGAHGVLRAAWGHFNQSQRPYELQVEDGEASFAPVERSRQWVLGYERLFKTSSAMTGPALRVELYRREVRNPRRRFENLFEPINNFPEVEPDRVVIEPERSVAEGLEIFLRGRVGRTAAWWVNYAYSSTEDRIRGDWVARKFDQTHSVNLDLDQRITNHWRLNLAWRYHTGWPTTPLAVEEVEDEQGEVTFVPVLGPLNSERLADYHRLDLRVSRQREVGRFLLTLYADVQNVYDRHNPAGFDIEIDAENGKILRTVESWTGFLPSLGIGVEF